MATGISVHRAPAFLDDDTPLATGKATRSWGDDRITADNRFIEVTARWRGRVTDVKRVNNGPLTVGGDGSNDLVVPVVGRSFEVVKRLPGGAWNVRFRDGMAGTVTWRGEALPLSRAGELGACVDGDAMALPLTDDVAVCLVVGDHTLEVRAVPKSRVVPVVAFFDSLWANAATLTMFAASALIAATVLFPVGMDDLDDELLTNPTRFQTMILKPPPRDNAFLDRLTTPASKPPAAAKPEGSTGAMKAKPTPDKGRMATVAPQAPSDEAVVQGTLARLFGDSGNSGMASVFNGDVAGGALNAALGTIDGNRVAGRGSAGLGLRGGAPGGGGAATGTLGTNRNSARGRSTGDVDYGSDGGDIGAKVDRTIGMIQGPIHTTGTLDPDLIRRVVRDHAGQVRYCYESQLAMSPGLTGKVVMRWVINDAGRVMQAGAGDNQTGNAALDACLASRIKTWVFPMPKGGGVVVVTYPFVFKPAG